MSNAPKRKFKLSKPLEPRSKEEISKDYTQIMTDLANNSYLHYCYGLHIENCQKNMVSLNQELKARNDLDAKQGKSNESQQSQN